MANSTMEIPTLFSTPIRRRKVMRYENWFDVHVDSSLRIGNIKL